MRVNIHQRWADAMFDHFYIIFWCWFALDVVLAAMHLLGFRL